MKLEKRGDVTAEEAAAAETPAQNGGKQKPVLLYLIILFAIAFLLILFSFVMHQRSNAEVLKELQSNVDLLQQLQDTEAKYQEALAENNDLRQQVQELEDQAAKDAKAQQAMALLWRMEQHYNAGDTEAAAAALADLQEDELYLSLPNQTEGDDTCESPRAAYHRIAAALETPAEE